MQKQVEMMRALLYGLLVVAISFDAIASAYVWDVLQEKSGSAVGLVHDWRVWLDEHAGGSFARAPTSPLGLRPQRVQNRHP